MDSWGTIVGGWVIVLTVIALYAGWLLLRARVVARELRLGDDSAADLQAVEAVDHPETDS